MADTEDTGFLDFLQATSVAAIDAFVNRQQSRVQQPTQLAGGVTGAAPALSGTTILVIGGLALLFLVMFAR